MRLLLVSAMVMTVCSAGAAAPPTGGAPARGDARAVTPAQPAALERLGLAALPQAPSPEALRALAAGKQALARRDLDRARAQLVDALARTPDLTEARYLLAVIDVRGGALAEARRRLEQLAAEDLAQLAPRIEADAELAPLRASPDGAALRARLAELRRLWEAAIAQGVPAQLYAGVSGNQGIFHPRVLRPGVWVDAVKRFFPLTPPVPELRAALVDLERGQTITVAFTVDDCRHDFCPIIRLTTVSVWPLAPAARPTATWSYRGELAHGAIVQSVDGGARVQMRDCLHARCLSAWHRVEVAGNRRDPEQRRLDVPTLEADHRGSSLALPATGLTLAGPALRPAGQSPIAIGKRHRLTDQHCVVSDGARALVTSTIDRCECNNFEGGVLVHELTRVDLTAGRAESLAIGKGVAAVLRGRDGGVYLQRGARVTRYGSIAELGPDAGVAPGSSGDPLPEGIVLAAPVLPRSNCCGL